jgi:hypothetical protein
VTKFNTKLPEFPASDDFNGIRFNSGTVGDKNNDIRFPDRVSTNSSSSIVSNSLRFNTNAVANAIESWYSGVTESNTGDFQLDGKLNFTWSSPTHAQTGNIYLYTGGNGGTLQGYITYGYNSPDIGGFGIRGQDSNGPPINNSSMGQVNTIYFRFKRVSGTITCSFSTDG